MRTIDRGILVVGTATTLALLGSVLLVMGNLLQGHVAAGGAAVLGTEDLMRKKEHGSCSHPAKSTEELRWGVPHALADKISCHTRRFAENAGYWESTDFLQSEGPTTAPVTFYDSVTGAPLFVAPKGRSWDAFVKESRAHGWPSFRDNEVVWDTVRVIKGSGETVSLTGTHLGHNLPDRKGNRYCINIAAIAAKPPATADADDGHTATGELR
mmetsp:Transcript_19669/g.51185  ORF Transcript_19669/g.51185 Transcript_19669/m.51185 type:complete len:212 (-) Transcript_19669:734-1369(-)